MITVRKISAVVIALLTVLTASIGCATEPQANEHDSGERSRWDVKSFPRLPSAETISAEIDNYQLPHRPEEGKALAYVVRPAWVWGLVRFGVYLDSRDAASKVGHNRTRQYIYFNLEPGEHRIYSKASNWDDIRVTVKAGDIIFIEQEQNALISNSLYQLAEDEGAYRIKRTKPGTILAAGA